MGNSQNKQAEQRERFRTQKAADDLKVEEQKTKREAQRDEQITKREEQITKREEEVTKRMVAIEATKREQEITKRQHLQLEQNRGCERRYPSYNEDNDKLNKD